MPKLYFSTKSESIFNGDVLAPLFRLLLFAHLTQNLGVNCSDDYAVGNKILIPESHECAHRKIVSLFGFKIKFSAFNAITFEMCLHHIETHRC